MLRCSVAALLLCFFLAAGARAGDASGRYQSVNLDQRTITIRVDGKDVTYHVDKEARFYDDAGRELRGGLRSAKDFFKDGQNVTFSTEKREDREWVVELKAKK
jgi:hypothetical protein